jgi:RimJ/RimL family protein N-acetyltransferase
MEIKAADRNILIPLFNNCQYDRVLIDSVLEGNFGSAYADSVSQPMVARLDSGAFTMLGGNPIAAGVKDLLRRAPIYYVTPQDNEWRCLIQDEFGTRISALPFTDYSSKSLDPARLAKLIWTVPPTFELKRIDKPLAEQLPSDIGNEYFFENFQSVDDFLGRGIGFCILHQNKIVSAATSMAQSSKAIDIEIETVPDFRKQGLGSVVGAKLVSYCLEQRIEPRWLAANAISEKLALKLGYVRGVTYETCAIQ